MKCMKRLLVLILSLAFIGAAAACTARPDKDTEDYPITSDWVFYSSELNGNVEERTIFDNEDELPHFSSPDGEHFDMTVTGETYYHGTVEAQEDGSYLLVRGEDGPGVRAVIDGNTLTIYVTNADGDVNGNLLFVAE